MVVLGEGNLTRYVWCAEVAEHGFCQTCGIYTHHRRRSKPLVFGVDAATLDGVIPRDLDLVPWVKGADRSADRPV